MSAGINEKKNCHTRFLNKMGTDVDKSLFSLADTCVRYWLPYDKLLVYNTLRTLPRGAFILLRSNTLKMLMFVIVIWQYRANLQSPIFVQLTLIYILMIKSSRFKTWYLHSYIQRFLFWLPWHGIYDLLAHIEEVVKSFNRSLRQVPYHLKRCSRGERDW